MTDTLKACLMPHAFQMPKEILGLLNRKGGDLLQESQARRVLTQGYISRTGHGTLPSVDFYKLSVA